MTFQDASTLFATFNLTGLKPALFDVLATNQNQTVADAAALQVESGSVGHVAFSSAPRRQSGRQAAP